MGNDSSKFAMPSIEGDAIEVTNAYVLRRGNMPNGSNCSVFSGAASTPLLTLAKNLKIYRHPNIVKYISSSHQKSHMYLVTEDVRPLTLIAPNLSALQICVGLNAIVSALSFLHKNGEVSHNNVCSASIFVTQDGTWKLGGLEFMKKFSETSSTSLSELRPRRYEKAVTPEETSGRVIPAAVDVYGLGVLIQELLQRFPDDELPSLQELRVFCHDKMLVADPSARCNLVDLMSHPFFCHDFIRIHSFLTELPLKTAEEKLEFYRELERQLHVLPETMVATQLISLLLARVVVLDSAAQQHLLPLLLRPRSEAHDDRALFSIETFGSFVVPKLIQMFCVRDVSVRLLLLTYLPGFVKCFTKDELRSKILPELLVGIKDIDDELVAATLRSLAILVSEIGGSAVIGGQRARLFSDGRPSARRPRRTSNTLPERPSPDGGEDTVGDDTETWSDWDQTNDGVDTDTKDQAIVNISPLRSISEEKKEKQAIDVRLPVTLADIDALDIKTSSGKRSNLDDDFFKDMEPVITHTQKIAAKAEDKFMATDLDLSSAAWDTFDEWGENPS